MSQELMQLRAFIASLQVMPLYQKANALDASLEALMQWAMSMEKRISTLEEQQCRK